MFGSESLLDRLNSLSTLALVFFAAVQIWRTEVERRERVRIAVGAFWIEYFRAWRVSRTWASADVIRSVQAGLFDPEEILPPDWGAILPLLGAMGPVPARLGGLAYAHALDAASHARLAVRYAVALSDEDLLRSGTKAAADQRDQLEVELKKALSQAGRSAAQTSDVLEDALASAPAWATKIRIDSSVLSSEPGKSLAERIQARVKALPWWRRTLGRVFPSFIMIGDRPERKRN